MNSLPTSRLRWWAFAWSCLIALAVPLHAAEDAGKPSAPATREMTIVICDTIAHTPTGGFPLNPGTTADPESAYDRMARIFPEVFEHRKWPLTFTTERLAAGEADHPLELRVFFSGVRSEIHEFAFYGWVTLTADGKKYDFGMIRAPADMRPFENFDDFLDKIYRRAALKIADKVGAVLFPDAKQ